MLLDQSAAREILPSVVSRAELDAAAAQSLMYLAKEMKRPFKRAVECAENRPIPLRLRRPVSWAIADGALIGPAPERAQMRFSPLHFIFAVSQRRYRHYVGQFLATLVAGLTASAAAQPSIELKRVDHAYADESYAREKAKKEAAIREKAAYERDRAMTRAKILGRMNSNSSPELDDVQAAVLAGSLRMSADSLKVNGRVRDKYGYDLYSSANGSSFKVNEADIRVENVSCKPKDGGHFCTFTERFGFRSYRPMLSEKPYREYPIESSQSSGLFRWVNGELVADDKAGPLVSLIARVSSRAGGRNSTSPIAGDRDSLNESLNQMARDQQDRRSERQEQWQRDQDWRREQSNGRCKIADICN